MARIVLAQACSHSPFLYRPAEEWIEIRDRRPVPMSVPHEDRNSILEKHDRCMAAFNTMKIEMEEAKPDVIVIFGDDQGEQFGFDNFPAFAVFVGSSFPGYRTIAYKGLTISQDLRDKTPEEWIEVQAHPDLAKFLTVGLVQHGFDPAFSSDIPNKDWGMGHAFMRPLHYITPRYDIPVIPIFVNCYFGPQPTANRCYHLGKAVRQIIESYPWDIRVAIIGSGGLWHTPGVPGSYLDEEFDARTLDAVKSGDGQAMADHFDAGLPDSIVNAYGDAAAQSTGGTGMYTGIGSGTGETRDWIVTAGVMDGIPGTIIDYVPVYASPCGMGFASWKGT
jgi:hypothetical protein